MNYADPADAIQPLLRSGERLLWSGRPKAGFFLRAEDAYLIPFSILWCGFIVFWEIQALRSGPVFFQLWGLPFLLVGVHLAIGASS